MHGPSILIAACLAAVTSGALALEGNPEAAREKISMCMGCHGIPGYRTTFPEVYSVPRLGGQHPEYIVRALQAYRDGERSHPTMQAIAQGLSAQDMADVAAYYGKRKEAAQ